MHILIPYDVTTTGMKNPYLYLLWRGLVKNKQVENVTVGYGWLNEQIDADIVHLHWPELLVKSRLADMSRVDELTDDHFTSVLDSIRSYKEKGSRVIITVHNERPHIDGSGLFHDYYSDIYELCDGFIHLGKSSENIIRQQFQQIVNGKPHFVIPHGNYSLFPNELTKEACRVRLNVNKHQKMLLSFGALRTERELNLGMESFHRASIPDSIYMMVGKLPYPYKSQLKHYTARKKLFLYRLKNRFRTVERVIPPDDVQIYLNASDLLIIPRFNTLNSGNVALGFTFGKVVIGPDYGVIGETLKETGNPVFDASRVDDVAKAIRSGFDLAELGKGEENKRFAENMMGWDMVADHTVHAYDVLLSSGH